MEAENRFQLTKDLFLEGMGLVSRDSYGKTARIGTFVLLGAWLVLLIAALAARQSPWFVVWEGLLIALVAVWLEVVLPRSRAKRAFRKVEAQSGGDMERIIRFYPEGLEAQSGDRTKQVDYTDVVKILRSRRLMVLLCRDKTGILLALNGFTLGSPERVQALIQLAQEEEKEEMKHA